MGGTKIVVVQLKQLIKTGAFAVLSLSLVIMLAYVFVPSSSDDYALVRYVPGTYSTQIMLDQNPISVDVTVSELEILAIELNNLSDSQAVSYPLLQPTMDKIATEIIETQSLEVEVASGQVETGRLLLQAVYSSLDQAIAN
jgi:uncharacterized protein with FMN-binding domain